jgi:hypothetical protein
VVVGVALLTVVVALGVIAVLNGRNGINEYEAGTPEATVQAYFQALIDDRPDDALTLLDSELGCKDHFRPTVRISRVVLEDVSYSTDDTEATIRVQVTETWGDGLFSPDESTFTETIRLGENPDDGSDDNWIITEPPWPYFDCRPGG